MRPWVPAVARGECLFGLHSVSAALKANRRTAHALFVNENKLEQQQKQSNSNAFNNIIKLATSKGVPVHSVNLPVLDKLTKNASHQGVVLDASKLEFQEIPHLTPPTNFTPKLFKYPVCVALDGVTDPMNMGSILRSCAFFGVHHVVTTSRNTAPLSPVVSKASAGCMEWLPVYATSSLPRFLRGSKQNGWFIIGTDPKPIQGEGSTQQVMLSKQLKLEQPTVLILGSEGSGLRHYVKAECDSLVMVPSASAEIDNLNVNVCTAILLHQLVS